MIDKRSNSQLAADKRYEAKRKGLKRLPGGYLTEDEDKLLCEMGERYGNKKLAIFKGLELLKKSGVND